MGARYVVDAQDDDEGYGWTITDRITHSEIAFVSNAADAIYIASVLEHRREPNEIVVTTEMLAAGIEAIGKSSGNLRSIRRKQELVDEVYRAMRKMEGGKRAFR